MARARSGPVDLVFGSGKGVQRRRAGPRRPAAALPPVRDAALVGRRATSPDGRTGTGLAPGRSAGAGSTGSGATGATDGESDRDDGAGGVLGGEPAEDDALLHERPQVVGQPVQEDGDGERGEQPAEQHAEREDPRASGA